MKTENLYNRRDAIKKILGGLATLYFPSQFLAGCASVSTTSGNIAKKDIVPFKYNAFFNKSQELTLFDKEGGLEADLNTEWEKLPNANLADYIGNPNLNAQEVTTTDREAKTTTQEAIIFYKGYDGNTYELSSSDGKFKIEKKAEGSGGGGAGGGGSGGASG